MPIVLGLAMLLAGPASALQITGISVAPTGANTANSLVNNGANRSQVASSTSVLSSSPGPVADVNGASVGFGSRYAFLLAADREAGGGSTSRSATSAYTVTFTVNNPTGALYQLAIDTSRVGALTLVDDGSGTASANLGAMVAQIDAVVNTGLGLASLGIGPTSGGAYTPFSQSSSTTLLETATSRTYVLTFTSSSSVTSAREEAAIRMGLAGALSSTTADDYPGIGGRSLAGDGHTVSVNATIIPEPPRGLLGLFGAALALGFRGRSPHVTA